MEEHGAGRAGVDELTVSRAWNAGWLRSDALRTTEGRPLTIVYRGRWTFGFCPDFRGALIAFGSELVRGEVEVHLRSGGWRAHGHHLDPAYNGVVLHVALDGDGRDGRGVTPCRRQDGVVVPTLLLGPVLRGPLAQLPSDPALAALGSIADDRCIAEVTPTNRAGALAAIERAGDARLTAKAATFEAQFTALPPGQVLYAGLLDALGYARNRAPMGALAGALPLAAIEARLPTRDAEGAFRVAAALLLGVGGFLPLDPALARLVGLGSGECAAIERAWTELGGPWRGMGGPGRSLADGQSRAGEAEGAGRGVGVAGMGWVLARARPANHPARRLLGLAAILARCGRLGLLAACLEPGTADDPGTGLRELRELLLGPPRPGDSAGRYVGADRVAEMLANVLLPFSLAYGAWAGDERLMGGAAALWEVAPASSGNEPTRALLAQIAGGGALRLRTGRQQQGALHLLRHYCEHRRCFECPIARLGRGTGETSAEG